MIVHYCPDEGLSLREPEDFRNFKIVLAPGSQQRPHLEALTFVDDDNALIGIESVPTLPGAPADSTWREGYDKMAAAAARFGWIDENARAIKAHVERPASPAGAP